MSTSDPRFLWGAQQIASAIGAKPHQVYRYFYRDTLKSIRKKGGRLVADREELIEEFRQLDEGPRRNAPLRGAQSSSCEVRSSQSNNAA